MILATPQKEIQCQKWRNLGGKYDIGNTVKSDTMEINNSTNSKNLNLIVLPFLISLEKSI